MEAVLIFKSYKGPVIVRNNNDYYCSGYDCKLGVYKYNKVQVKPKEDNEEPIDDGPEITGIPNGDKLSDTDDELVDLSFDDEGNPEPTYNYLNQ
mgnify:FL=1